MNKLIFFLFFVGLSWKTMANEIILSAPVSNCPYNEKEIELFEHLSEKHLNLLKKEAELKAREEELNKKERSLQEQGLNTTSHQNSFAKIYAQLPPSKAIQLLDLETPQKAAEILLQLPSATAGLLINKTEAKRAQLILQYMSELQKQ